MSFISVFDVLGPNMIGPSSSHTAGAARIGFLAQKMIGGSVVKVDFTLYGSFARTYHGHGTDRALLGGIMGFDTDDMRIRDSFDLASEQGIAYSFTPNELETDHRGYFHGQCLRSDDDCPGRVFRRRQGTDRADQSGKGGFHR